eukprot:TRINITY_DN21311_c0_g1_i1.p1 TRINITY_DN21311_c0_g1~~TRINITY_DN21311_c0_g1_i1.p1  ORF type:complete len:735 (+),score=62.96 TRINITY_DN21311_c0_g1_i1:161-2365(+)
MAHAPYARRCVTRDVRSLSLPASPIMARRSLILRPSHVLLKKTKVADTHKKKEELIAIEKEKQEQREQLAAMLLAQSSTHQDEFQYAPPRLVLPTHVADPASLTEDDVGTVVTLPPRCASRLFPDLYPGDLDGIWKSDRLIKGWLWREPSHLMNLLVQKFRTALSVPRKAAAIRQLTNDTRGVLLYGASGAGKSVVAAQALHAARAAGDVITVVLRIPDWTHGAMRWLEPSIMYPGYWDQPIEAARVLGGLLDVHGSLLQSLPLKGQWQGLLPDDGSGKSKGLRTLRDLTEWAVAGNEALVRATRAKREHQFAPVHGRTIDDRFWNVEHSPPAQQDRLLVGFAAVLEELLVTDAPVLVIADGINMSTSWTHFCWHPTSPTWAEFPHPHGIPAERLVPIRWLRLFFGQPKASLDAFTAPLTPAAAASLHAPTRRASSSNTALGTSDDALQSVVVAPTTGDVTALEQRRSVSREGVTIQPLPGETAVEQATRAAEELAAATRRFSAERLDASDAPLRRLVIGTTDEGHAHAMWTLQPFYTSDFPLHPLHIGSLDRHEVRALFGWLYDTHPVDDRRQEWRGRSKGSREQILQRVQFLSGGVARDVVAHTLRVYRWALHASGVFEPRPSVMRTDKFKASLAYKRMQWTPHLVGRRMPKRKVVADLLYQSGGGVRFAFDQTLDPETRAKVEKRRELAPLAAGTASFRLSDIAEQHVAKPQPGVYGKEGMPKSDGAAAAK